MGKLMMHLENPPFFFFHAGLSFRLALWWVSVVWVPPSVHRLSHEWEQTQTLPFEYGTPSPPSLPTRDSSISHCGDVQVLVLVPADSSFAVLCCPSHERLVLATSFLSLSLFFLLLSFLLHQCCTSGPMVMATHTRTHAQTHTLNKRKEGCGRRLDREEKRFPLRPHLS
jgi:hypothetical protein